MGPTSQTEIAITIATRKYGRACSINSQTDTVSFPLLIHGEKCKKERKKTKKNHANESMQSQRGQKAKPSRDMNHRDSHREIPMPCQRVAHCSHSVAYQQRQHLNGVGRGGYRGKWREVETVFPITRHYRNVPYTRRVVGFE